MAATLNGISADIKHEFCRVGSIKNKASNSVRHKQGLKKKPKIYHPYQQQEYSKLIYFYLLQLLIVTIRLVQLVQIHLLRMIYIVREYVVDASMANSNELRLLTAPNHVCVILNEHVNKDMVDFKKKCELIVDLMHSHGTHFVTFYCATEQYDIEFKQKLVDKYKVDSNNNGLKFYK